MAKQNTTFFDSPKKHFIAALLGFMAAYGTASVAIDTGSLMVYGLTILLVVLSLGHLVRGIRKVYAK